MRRLTHARGPSHELLLGGVGPQLRLVGAILELAVDDYRHGDPGARAFVASADLDYWCTAAGLNPDAFREKLARLALSK